MRAVAVHGDALVVTSRLWQTTATIVRGGGSGEGAAEAMLIDSPYFPDELELLPEVMRQAGFEVTALLATHADFDHLLGPLAFPGLALGMGESSAERLRARPGEPQRELRDADAEHYVTRTAPLSLGGVQSLPVPGALEIGSQEVELHPAGGHTVDGVAILAPHAGVLVCGDYLSDVEIPVVGHSLGAYRATLERLSALLERVATVVPGHGSPRPSAEARRTLEEDDAYLDALERGDERPTLPPGRDSSRQRAIHGENLRVAAG